ncbi:histone acetyltransferase [Apiospora kogelbergensis]|uniref:histone acetyltransferase n=1 Tax=Apiospora kogelbergensis TaxID=1337665 RepID=UPI00313099F7
MVHSKRKRVHDENPAEAESASRRTTRHSHPTTLLTEHDAEPEKPLRSRRVRSDTHDAPTEPTLPISAAAPITKTYVTRPRDTTAKTSDPDSAAPRPKVPHATIRRTKRHSATADHVDAADHAEGKENLQPAHLADAKGAAAPSSPHQRSPVAPHPRPRAPGPSAPASPDNPAAACRGSTSSIITPKRRLSIQPQKPPPTPRSDRNIDRVVLGDISFRAWYPSYYGKDVLGDASVTSGGKANPGGGGGKIGGGKKDKEVLLDRLFVCPSCFKYSKEEPKWRKHINACLPKAWVPGAKIYVHPKESRTPQSTSGSDARRKSKPKKEDGSAPVTEGEWSVWEVDGENEPLFCQNLSLFAKLFLDNKSVFFDVAGFNYFLLVYTPPPAATPSESDVEQSPAETSASRRPQVVGFFSKEKLSWDNNNLACILVFPPWQRKGLGALLMGVSYEISRREKVLGGPEKPISELGKKGYRRFWAGEICRWLLGLELPSKDEQEIIVDAEECSQATWITPEDCLAVIRDMGIMVEDGMGPGKKADSPADERHVDAEQLEEAKQVARVKIDKDDVRKWVKDNRIDLERACDPDGFVEGYAIKLIEAEEGEEEEEE